MNWGLKIYAVVITLSFIALWMAYLLHRKEVKRLSIKIQGLLVRSTHTELTTDFPSADVTELVNSLNGLFEVYQEQVYELQKKDETIKETITNLAHDLRTPMTAIQGYTQMLMGSSTLSNEDLENIRIINERLAVLNQLLNQLFEFARIEAGEMEFSYVTLDLNALLRGAAVSFFGVFEERNLVPELNIAEEPFPFYGDEKAIVRIFENIISNALAHGKGDYVFSSYVMDRSYKFVFQNSTDDIRRSDIDKIFERFYTTDQSRSKKTTGLGLTIAKKLTLQMGGTIGAALKGEMFEITVCFPASEEEK